jgi:ElaA protein
VAGWLLVSTVQDAATKDLDAGALYRILALRSAVFVVEQNCVYLDPDGRDLEPNARQVWIERDGDVVATLRLLADAAEDHAGSATNAPIRIGRVATRADCRGAGLAAALVRRALHLCEGRVIVLSAQTYLADWYGRFGFVIDGPEFLDDGIPHVPMRRPHRGSAEDQPK